MSGPVRGSRRSAPAEQPRVDLSAAEGALLARTAARAVEATLSGVPRDGWPPTWAALRRTGASFVSMYHEGELRGCIGTLAAVRPLYVDVAVNAVRAMRDPRLAPVTAVEWPRLDVSVSVLSPLVPVPAADLAGLLAILRPGLDGLVITAGARQATFLPLVWEKLPDPRSFVDHLLAKGGWRPGRLPDDVTVARYTTLEFHDPSPRVPLS